MPTTRARAPWVGLVVALALVAVAFAVPPLFDWEVWPRAPRSLADGELAPLHGYWQPKLFGPGTLPAIALALLGWRYAVDLAERLSWRRLLLTSYVVGLAWLLALAFVDGTSGISRVLGRRLRVPALGARGHRRAHAAADVRRPDPLLGAGQLAGILQGEHFDWGTYVFNYGRGEVLTFLLSNAMYWLTVYHLDGFRVDAVASMLYLDHQRPAGEWVPNRYGGRENLEAVDFLRRGNICRARAISRRGDHGRGIDSWPMVSRPVHLGGLGFTMKWNMGWMHDMLEYVKADPIYRRFIHNTVTFSMFYNYSENFVLPLSHDEVVHGKSPLVYKAPGDEWQKFATLRLLFGYMWAHPGKKLLFMGGEFAQTIEWAYARPCSGTCSITRPPGHARLGARH